MTPAEVDVREQIVAFKRTLTSNREGLKRAFADVKDHVRRAGDGILKEVAAGRSDGARLDYRAIRAATFARASASRSGAPAA